jgi:hypothetical protein
MVSPKNVNEEVEDDAIEMPRRTAKSGRETADRRIYRGDARDLSRQVATSSEWRVAKYVLAGCAVRADAAHQQRNIIATASSENAEQVALVLR